MATHEIDRTATVPFHLKLFYKSGTFHRHDEFQHISSLPPPVEISTWPDCTLRELSHHLVTNIPDLVPSPPIGTRLHFRLVFPDTKISHARSLGPGRYTSKDLGTVVIGSGLPSSSPSFSSQPKSSNNENVDPNIHEVKDEYGSDREGKPTGFNGGFDSLTEAQKDIIRGGLLSGDCGGSPDKQLQDARFIIGDYVDCAIMPPLSNGDIAPVPEFKSENNSGPTHVYSFSGAGGRGGHVRNGSGGAGTNDFIHPSRRNLLPSGVTGGSWRSQQGDSIGVRGGEIGGQRENGFGGFRTNGRGGRGGNMGYGREEVPVGEWRRGEKLPDAGPRGGRDYGYGRGRGGGRW